MQLPWDGRLGSRGGGSLPTCWKWLQVLSGFTVNLPNRFAQHFIDSRYVCTLIWDGRRGVLGHPCRCWGNGVRSLHVLTLGLNPFKASIHKEYMVLKLRSFDSKPPVFTFFLKKKKTFWWKFGGYHVPRRGSPRVDSYLALRNNLSKETRVVTKQMTLLGKGHPGGEQQGKGTQEICSATWLTALVFMGMRLVSGLSLAS